MEKAVGEVFGFNNVKLQVKDIVGKACCDGCYFNGLICKNNETIFRFTSKSIE